MTQETKRTPTPYRAEHRAKIVQKVDGHEINPVLALVIERDDNTPGNRAIAWVRTKDDAAFIVRACNAHDTLIYIVNRLVDNIENPGASMTGTKVLLEDAAAILAKARGEV